MARKPMTTVLGVPTALTRKRYGRKTYTWAYALAGGVWQCIGLPWEGTLVDRVSLEQAMSEWLRADGRRRESVDIPPPVQALVHRRA